MGFPPLVPAFMQSGSAVRFEPCFSQPPAAACPSAMPAAIATPAPSCRTRPPQRLLPRRASPAPPRLQAGASKAARERMAQHQEFFEFNQARGLVVLHSNSGRAHAAVACALAVDGPAHPAAARLGVPGQPAYCVRPFFPPLLPCRARRSTTLRSFTTRWGPPGCSWQGWSGGAATSLHRAHLRLRTAARAPASRAHCPRAPTASVSILTTPTSGGEGPGQVHPRQAAGRGGAARGGGSPWRRQRRRRRRGRGAQRQRPARPAGQLERV